MHPTNALGLDGTPTLFYQQFWDLVGLDVKRLVLNNFNDEGDPTTINKTLIALIQKVKRPTNAIRFRLISLCINVIFKIVKDYG